MVADFSPVAGAGRSLTSSKSRCCPRWSLTSHLVDPWWRLFPSDLLSSLFTKRLARWRHVGGGIPTRRSRSS